MIDPEDTLREIVRSSHALRDRAAAVRERSRAVLTASRTLRDATDRSAPTSGAEPALGEIPVSDLFVILVDRHGLSVLEAVRVLANGMTIAGYPLDGERIGAADALDILHAAVHRRE